GRRRRRAPRAAHAHRLAHLGRSRTRTLTAAPSGFPGLRWRCADHDPAVLREVMIECESVSDAQSFHYGKAGGIGEREVFVLVLVNDLSRPLLVPRADTHDRRRAALVNLV